MALEKPSTRSKRSWFRRLLDFGVEAEFGRELSRIERLRKATLKPIVFKKKVITQTDAFLTIDNAVEPQSRVTIDTTVRRLEIYSRQDVDRPSDEEVLERLRARFPPIRSPADLKKPIGDIASSMTSRELRVILDRDAARNRARKSARIEKKVEKQNSIAKVQKQPQGVDDGRTNGQRIKKDHSNVSSPMPVKGYDHDDPSQLQRYQELGVITKDESIEFLQRNREKLEKARQKELKNLQGDVKRNRVRGPPRSVRKPLGIEYPIIPNKDIQDGFTEDALRIVRPDSRVGTRMGRNRKRATVPRPHTNAFFRNRNNSDLVLKLSSAIAGGDLRDESPKLVSKTNVIGHATSTTKSTTIAMRSTTITEETVTVYASDSSRSEDQLFDYRYERLENDGQFRLLAVEPWDDNGHFSYELKTFSMSNAPPYETVSYVWGQDERRFLLSFKDSTVLQINRSLFSALPLLSRHCQSGYLWIDQVCIDQSNVKERNHQVKYMGAVYKQAEKVYIFLGRMTHVVDIESLLALLRHVEESHSTTTSPQTIIRLQDSLETIIKPSYDESSPASRQWRDLVRLFQHPWFTRAWVFQELVLSNIVLFAIDQKLATLDAIINAGNATVGLEKRTLSDFRYDLCLTKSPGFQQLRFMADVRTGRIVQGSIDPELFWIILSQVAPICQSSNEQDTLYAFLGLLEDPRFDIWPDYSCTVLDSFVQAASIVTAGQESLSLLAFIDRAPLQYSPLPLVPSWVPDWRQTQTVKIFNQKCFHADIYRKHHPACCKDGFQYIDRGLLVRGRIIGKITYVATSSFYSAKPWESRDLCSFLNLDEHLSKLMRHFGQSFGKPKQILERLMRVALADGSEGSMASLHPRKVERLLEAYHRYGRSVTIHHNAMVRDGTSSGMPEPCRLFLRELRQLSTVAFGRRLFATQKMKLGLGPDEVAVGDYVCVLHGSSLPVVMRRSKHGSSQFYVKGQCFQEDVMQGEAATWAEDDAAEFLIV